MVSKLIRSARIRADVQVFCRFPRHSDRFGEVVAEAAVPDDEGIRFERGRERERFAARIRLVLRADIAMLNISDSFASELERANDAKHPGVIVDADIGARTARCKIPEFEGEVVRGEERPHGVCPSRAAGRTERRIVDRVDES